MGKDWRLCELLALQKLREGSTTRVLRVDLLHFDGVVGEEEHHGVVLVATIICEVFPLDGEAEDAAIIVQELLETTVGATTLQFDLNVVFEFSLIGRRLLHVDHGAGVCEWILRVVLCWTDIDTLIGVVAACELITVHDAEDAAIDIEVHTEAEIGPVVVARAVGLKQLGTLQEDALRDARVGHARLKDVEGVIVEVEVDDALSNAIVLRGVLNDGLEEVSFEIEDLNIGN